MYPAAVSPRRAQFLKFLGSSYGRTAAAVLFVLVGYMLLFIYFTNSYTSQIYALRGQQLERLVEVGLNVIQPLRTETTRGDVGANEARAAAADLLRRMTYRPSQGQTALFMGTYTGTALVPAEGHLTGSNLWDLQDAEGLYVTRELVRAATTGAGSGFVRYDAVPPGGGAPQHKQAYVVGIPEWGAYIGTSAFLTDVEEGVRSYLASSLLLIIALAVLILGIVYLTLRPAVRSYTTLLQTFNHVTLYPDDIPDLPLDRFRPGSEGWKLLSGFQEMLTRLQRSREAVQESEHALREREEQYRSIVESTTDALIITDLNGRIVEANPAAWEMHGYTRGELVGQMVGLIHPARNGELRRVRAAVEAGERLNVRTVTVRRDGAMINVELRATPFSYRDQLHILAVLSDVTEQVRAYQTLEQHVAERTHALATLLEVSQNVASTLEVEPLLNLILDQLQSVVDYSGAAIYTVDADEHVRLLIYRGPVPLTKVPAEWPVGDAPGYCQVLDSRVPVIIPDTQADTPPAQALRASAGQQAAHMRSWMGVPMLARDRVVGMLGIDHLEPGYYSEARARLVLAFASNAAVAIENARLYTREQDRLHEAEQRRELAEGLRDILAYLNSDRQTDEILEFIVAQAGRFLETDSVAIYRLDESGDMLRIQTARGLPDDYVSSMSLPVGRGIPGRAVMQRRPLRVSDLAATLSTSTIMEDRQRLMLMLEIVERYRSALAVPLFIKNEIYGAIVLYYRETREFTDEEVRLAVAFGDQAALAVENARLRAQVGISAVAAERQRLARDLHDAVTQTLFSASLIADVLPRLWDKRPEDARKRLEDLRELTRGALAEMRTLLLELRPSTLTEAELSELLRQLTEAMVARARLPVTLTIEGEAPLLPPDVQVALYRIAQEALNNVTKHAGASAVSVNLKTEGAALTLTIEDNGHGFDPASIPPDHLGLGIMRERAETIGALLEIDSQPRRGTRLQVQWRANTEETTDS